MQTSSGVCAAICTETFTSGATDRPGAFSLICCGPQVIEGTTLGGKDANKQTSSLIQMQLKTTNTTTRLSEKDIKKTITKFGFTIPRDFYELARLVQNMAGATELLFGFNARLTVMLDNFFAPDCLIEDILSRFDCYLDDIFGAFYVCDKAMSMAAILMALHTVGQSNKKLNGKSFPGDKLLSLSKFVAEAKPLQCKIILGWLVDTRAFAVKLPGEMQHSWSLQIDDLLHSGWRPVQAKDLAMLLGRLNNASHVIPNARHFTGRLHKARTCAEAKGAIILSGPQLDNLGLGKRFLQYNAEGISINCLVCKWPMQIVRVDASPQGMGGHCL